MNETIDEIIEQSAKEFAANHEVGSMAGSVFVCSSIGVTMDEVTFEQLTDGTWRAVQPVGSIFGCEVDGECSGIGKTQKEALEALKEDRESLNESMWVE